VSGSVKPIVFTAPTPAITGSGAEPEAICHRSKPKALSTKPVARAGSAASGLIGGICPPAFVDRKASTPDALGEPVAQTLKLGNHLIDAFRPCPRKTRPVLARGAAISGKLGEFRPDFLKGQPDPLREHDEGDAAQDRPGIAAVP